MGFLVYHSADLDGWASAAVIRHRHPNLKLIPIDYGEEFPLERIKEEKHPAVFMVDYAPNDLSLMDELVDTCTVFVWIDHRASSIEGVKERGLMDKLDEGHVFYLDAYHEKYAACELTYMWMFNVDYDKIPYYFKLLGRYDIWDHSDPNTLPFQYAMRSWIDNPKDNMAQWKRLLNCNARDQELFKDLLEKGKFTLEYERKKNAAKAQAISFELDFRGYKALAANETHTNSKFFDAVYSPDRHNLLIVFAFTGTQWKVSFYSPEEDVDVSAIAKEFGGGGHKGAAGATVSELPKELKDKVCV